MHSLFSKHWFLLTLALGLGAALTFPAAIRSVTDFWEPRWAIAISLFLIAWTMPTRSLLSELRHPFASLWAVILSYGLVPGAAVMLGWMAPDKDVCLGLILVSSVPCTLSSAVLWTRLAGGNEATALLTVMGTTFTSWFMTTAWLSWLTATDVALDVPAMMLDLVLSLIVPTVLGQALRQFAPCARFAERHKVALGVLSQCFVLAIVLKAGASVGEKLQEDSAWDVPRIVLWSVVLAVALHLVALGGALYSARWLGLDRGRQIAIAFASSQKTLPIALVLYEQFFRPAFPFAVLPLLFYHVGQLLLDTMIAKRLRKNPGAEIES
jgi:solute carrier family 10 (sodium/bile acid cotransporter), member 7